MAAMVDFEAVFDASPNPYMLFEVAPDVRDRLGEVLHRVRDTARPAFANELALTLDRGGPVDAWFDVVYQPVVSAAGEVEAILIVASEVTETVLARRQSEVISPKLEAIFESVPEPLYAGDARGILRANAAARALIAAGGLGLGLSIVKHVVDAHHGSVAAFSAGPGRGATFRVRLPLRPDVPGRADDPASWPAPGVLEGMSVLVIDDERDTRDYVRSLLEQSKAHVTVATSAAEGLRRLAEVHPDVVLSDIVMPLEDGYSFVRRMRALAEPAISRTPAIALTAHARAEERARAMRAGFQNHVAKPIDGGELLAAIATFAPRRLGADQPPR